MSSNGCMHGMSAHKYVHPVKHVQQQWLQIHLLWPACRNHAQHQQSELYFAAHGLWICSTVIPWLLFRADFSTSSVTASTATCTGRAAAGSLCVGMLGPVHVSKVTCTPDACMLLTCMLSKAHGRYATRACRTGVASEYGLRDAPACVFTSCPAAGQRLRWKNRVNKQVIVPCTDVSAQSINVPPCCCVTKTSCIDVASHVGHSPRAKVNAPVAACQISRMQMKATPKQH